MTHAHHDGVYQQTHVRAVVLFSVVPYVGGCLVLLEKNAAGRELMLCFKLFVGVSKQELIR